MSCFRRHGFGPGGFCARDEGTDGVCSVGDEDQDGCSTRQLYTVGAKRLRCAEVLFRGRSSSYKSVTSSLWVPDASGARKCCSSYVARHFRIFKSHVDVIHTATCWWWMLVVSRCISSSVLRVGGEPGKPAGPPVRAAKGYTSGGTKRLVNQQKLTIGDVHNAHCTGVVVYAYFVCVAFRGRGIYVRPPP